MIATLYVCGLRRSEIVATNLEDYNQTTGKIVIRQGKGRKERTVYTEEAKAYVDLWLERRG